MVSEIRQAVLVVPKKPAARALFWYVKFKGADIEGMTVEQIAVESGTPVSSVYEHAESVGLWIERQKATVTLTEELKTQLREEHST